MIDVVVLPSLVLMLCWMPMELANWMGLVETRGRSWTISYDV